MRYVLGVLAVLCALGRANAQPGAVYAVVTNDTVAIWNTGVGEHCGAQFQFDVTVLHGRVTVTERDTAGFILRCWCPFTLSVTIAGLPAGDYVADVYREYLQRYGYRRDTIVFVGSAFFRIGQQLPVQRIVRYQSPCLPSAAGGEPETYPSTPLLHQNFPNPFNAATTIRIRLPRLLPVRVSVYTLLGEEIRLVADRVMSEGTHDMRFDAGDLATGVYLYRLRAGPSLVTRAMLLLR